MATDTSAASAAGEWALGIARRNGGNQQQRERRQEQMKYIVIGKRNQVPMEPKMAVGLLQAAKESTKAGLADGSIEVSYINVDSGGGFTIVNADSHEQAMDGLLAFPLYVFMDWEVIPLVDWSHGYDKLTELFQKMSG
jgi:hypothetical protein